MLRLSTKLLFVAIFQIVPLCSVTMAEDDFNSLKGKIVGGERANISDFPHAVFLDLKCSKWEKKSVVCGSSVLNQRILLTAAHCLQCDQKVKRITAYAGYEDWTMALNSGAVRKALSYAFHPNYSKQTFENDIGLVLLKKQLPLNDNIKRVIIESSFPRLTKRTKTYVAGWGNIQEIPTKQRDKWLKSVEVHLVPTDECESRMGEDNIFPGMMCAGTPQFNVGRPAGGDSGSALITSHYQQLGIVSWRYGFDFALLVYTNVTYFYPWISNLAKRLYCNKYPLTMGNIV